MLKGDRFWLIDETLVRYKIWANSMRLQTEVGVAMLIGGLGLTVAFDAGPDEYRFVAEPDDYAEAEKVVVPERIRRDRKYVGFKLEFLKCHIGGILARTPPTAT